MTEQQKRLVEALQEFARRPDVGKVTLARFVDGAGFSRPKLYAAFPDGWSHLCAAAGIEPLRRYYRLTDDQIFEAMRAAFVAQGGITTAAEFQRHFVYGFNVLHRRGLTWPEALFAFRAWTLVHAPDFPHLDQLSAAAPRPRPWHRRSAIERALGERSRDDAPPVRELGPRIDFRGCLYAPTNEQGVVFLFGAMAADLGYAVETLGVRFPDCRAKFHLSGGGWRDLRIELEYKASNFLLHGHDPKGCDLIVCWENDWPECPVPVVELKTEVERLAKLDRARGGRG